MIFPYTPTVIFSHSAAYSRIKPTHSNYPFPYIRAVNRQLANYWRILYRRCRRRALLGSLCTLFEDQLLKWLMVKHLMQGTPPIVLLNGYGDYVFKNVPVVIINFSVDLPTDVDYIHVPS